MLCGSAEAAQEAPDDDGSTGGQEDDRGTGVVIGRQRQVAPQRHVGPEADDKHGQPRCPEDEAEGHEGQLEQGHGVLKPWHRASCGGEGVSQPSVPPDGEEGPVAVGAAAPCGRRSTALSGEERAPWGVLAGPGGSRGRRWVRSPAAAFLSPPAAAGASGAALCCTVPFSVAGAGARPAAALVGAAGPGGTGRDGTGRDRTGVPSPLPVPSSFKRAAALR